MKLKLIILYFLYYTSPFSQQIYYVATDGSDSSDGLSTSTPFRTIHKAIDIIQLGDVINIRGGIYEGYFTISVSGTKLNPIVVQSYRDENAIIDGSSKQTNIDDPWNMTDNVINITGDHINIKGIEVQNAASISINIRGNNVTIDSAHIHNGYLTGVYFYKCDSGLVSNSNIHDFYDYSFGGINGGGNADGIGASSGNTVTTVYGSHKFINNKIFNCSDDCIDTWTSENNYLANNIVYHAGFTNLSNGGSISSGEPAGDGNGFKLGKGGYNTVIKNISYYNRVRNFDCNNGDSNTLYNNTAYDTSGKCFVFYTVGNVLKNNLSFGTINLLDTLENVYQNNSWDLGIIDPLFLSTDPSAETFLRLSSQSPAIDAGVFVGVPFLGLAPDIGAFEFNEQSDILLDANEFEHNLYKLQQNYPNPFNPSTIISYSLPEKSFVKIRIFDTLGREVLILVNEEKPAGVHQVEFKGSNLASGVYLYSIEAGNFFETKKMILLK